MVDRGQRHGSSVQGLRTSGPERCFYTLRVQFKRHLSCETPFQTKSGICALLPQPRQPSCLRVYF